VDTVEAFGALKIVDVLEPAIQLAEGGFVPFIDNFAGSPAYCPLQSPSLGNTQWRGMSQRWVLDSMVDTEALVAKIGEDHQGGVAGRK